MSRWSFSSHVALLFAIGIGGLGCQAPNESQPAAGVSQEDLIQFNRNKLVVEEAMLDSLSLQWSVMHKMTHDTITPAGLRAWSGQPWESRLRELEVGDTVSWIGEMRLIDSTLVMEWTDEAPFQFIWNRSDWPRGFHEFANLLGEVGEGECLIPSHLGWGLSGWPPLIPQEAVLWLNISQNASNNASVSLAPYSGRLQWNEMLNAFELGHWPGGSDWISHRQLAGSPCLAWYDAVDSFDTVPSALKIELRTFKWQGRELAPLTLGLTEWEFSRQDEGQLLPVLQELLQMYPKQKKWECWCPVDLAFGQEGVPEAGMSPSEVVGFQWALTEVEPLKTAALIGR
jgi:hypothetical protein